VRSAIRPLSPHCAPTAMVALENTHNMHGGTVYPLDTVREICDGAHERGLRVHMDGARIFNAATALNTSVREIARSADTLMFCLSKGLCAPVGSILAGPADLIAKGRLYRKRLGGGMRQAGVLAAACLIALEEMPDRLCEDHENAKFLGEGLARLPGIRIDARRVVTNIVIFDVTETRLAPEEIVKRLRQRGVLMAGINRRQMRAVTHRDVDRAACGLALEAMKDAVAA
jgi:threonine aldolase